MPLDITFTLSDQDLEHFQTIVDRAKSALEEAKKPGEVEKSARSLIADAKSRSLPDFIAERLLKLETVINMVSDEEWRLSDDERQRVLGALVYFTDPEDLIPDHIPGLGFLDDAIYVELIIRELKAEIDSYEEFCAFRTGEEKRRIERGQDPHVEREAWLADKRSTLHARMRRRRRAGSGSSGGWRFRW
ncbi:MAG: YkvA family protein [Woeseia sp.]